MSQKFQVQIKGEGEAGYRQKELLVGHASGNRNVECYLKLAKTCRKSTPITRAVKGYGSRRGKSQAELSSKSLLKNIGIEIAHLKLDKGRVRKETHEKGPAT